MLDSHEPKVGTGQSVPKCTTTELRESSEPKVLWSE